MAAIHDSHNVIRTNDDDGYVLRAYCLECEEWGWMALSQPCRGNPHTGNIVLPEHLPRGAILRGQ